MINLKNCVVTLPITPIENPNIGLMVIPFLMDILSKRMGIDSLLALNVNGAKLYNDSIEKNVNGYLSSIKKMGIFCNFIWKDDQGENIFWINKFFNQLRKEKYIVQERTKIMKCECGLVESIAEAENISCSRRVYFIKGNKKYCKVCNTEVVEDLKDVYLFEFPNFISFGNIYPECYRKELGNMVKKFSRYKFLISRSRLSALAIWTGEDNIFLDIDFVWQMYLPIIRRYGYDPLFLIGGNKNMMACCFVMIMDKLIDNKEVAVIIPPYYLAPDRKSLKTEKYLLNFLMNKYDAKTIRLFLASALNWNKKEAILDFKLLDLIYKMSYRITSREERTDIKNALLDFDGKNIKIFLAKVRKNRTSFCSRELFGLI